MNKLYHLSLHSIRLIRHLRGCLGNARVLLLDLLQWNKAFYHFQSVVILRTRWTIINWKHYYLLTSA